MQSVGETYKRKRLRRFVMHASELQLTTNSHREAIALKEAT